MMVTTKPKLDMGKFIEDIKRERLELSEDRDGVINLTNYIMRDQANTRLYDYVNQDVYIGYDPEINSKTWHGKDWKGNAIEWKPSFALVIEDYGNGCPNWVYDTLGLMVETIERVGGLK